MRLCTCMCWWWWWAVVLVDMVTFSEAQHLLEDPGNRPDWLVVQRMTENAELALFEDKFASWPDEMAKYEDGGPRSVVSPMLPKESSARWPREGCRPKPSKVGRGRLAWQNAHSACENSSPADLGDA